MNGKLHMKLGIFVGISGGLLVCTQMDPQPLPLYISTASAFAVGAAAGSLTPDIDTPTSTISKWIPLLPTVINKAFGHRGFLHSPCFIILTCFLLNSLNLEGFTCFLAYGFITGYVAHLAQDIFTKGGVPLLYPFSREKFSLGWFKSGSKIDRIITTGLEIIWIIFSIYILIAT